MIESEFALAPYQGLEQQGLVNIVMRTLVRSLGLAAVLASLGVCAAAQSPLSPPDRSPVPMSDVDQNRAREEALRAQSMQAESKGTSQAAAPTAPAVVKIPIESLLPHHVTSGNTALDALILEAAAKYNLDPCLVLSVMNAESGFRPTAVSPKGASGLMQLMPETAVRFGVRNIFDPRENLMAGANYLRWLLDRFGDVRLALAGYNAGEGAVEFYGHRIPPFLETQNYVQIIYSRYTRMRAEQPAPTVNATTVAQQVQGGEKTPSEKPPTYNQIIPFIDPKPAPQDSGSPAK